jgi:hypothetical protein
MLTVGENSTVAAGARIGVVLDPSVAAFLVVDSKGAGDWFVGESTFACIGTIASRHAKVSSTRTEHSYSSFIQYIDCVTQILRRPYSQRLIHFLKQIGCNKHRADKRLQAPDRENPAD